MRQDAEALIRRYYTAFNAGDRAGMLALLAPDIAHDVNEGGRRTGKALFQEFMNAMDRAYREELREIVVMANEAGTRAAAEFTVHGTYIASEPGLPEAQGQAYVLPAGAFFAVRGGFITRITTYYNLRAWIAQVSGS